MRYSPSLNIIIKTINKVSGRLSRDFGEIENLQNNHSSVTKFTNFSYERVQKDLIYDLTKSHPDYNIKFLDGKKIINNKDAEYNYIVCPIDGLLNLSRAIPCFSTFIALEYIGKDKENEIVAVAVNNAASNELYFCEKGHGAYLNNHRIRVSERKVTDNILGSISNLQLVNHKSLDKLKSEVRFSGCRSLDICYLAASRYDLCLFKKADTKVLKILSLLVKESGGSIVEKDDIVMISNTKIII